jgi:cholesterol 25-hydroxylase
MLSMPLSTHLQSQENIVSRIRAVLRSLFASAVAFPDLYQPFLTPLRQWLRHSLLDCLSTFEMIWTVFLYTVIEVSMTVVFLQHPEWRFAVQDNKKQDDAGAKRPNRVACEDLHDVGVKPYMHDHYYLWTSP